MSALTKVFVILHVVLTMLFVSAAIVFVNRVEDHRAAKDQADKELQRVSRQASFDLNQAQVALADAVNVKTAAETAMRGLREQLNTAQAGNIDRDKQLAAAKQDLLSAQASLQAATAALGTTQDSNKLLTAQITETRTAADKIQQQNTELLTANSTLNQSLQTATRQLRNANETIEELQTQVASFQDRGGAPAGPAGGAEARPGEGPGITPAVAINGVVRAKRNVNGVPYATISVGSQDGVTEDMVFNVIERGGQGRFLGYLRVDRVEPNEAVGRLEGPAVNDIQPDKSEVRTQL